MMKSFWENEKELDIIKKCRLFLGIHEQDLPKTLLFLEAKPQVFLKNEFLLSIGETFHYAGLVLSGTVEGSFQSETFDKINMKHFEEGMVFGEALACLEIMDSPIQLRAVTKCKVLWMNLKGIYETDALKNSWGQKFAVNLIRIFAEQNLYQNKKIRVLGQRKLRDRLLLYLSGLSKEKDGGIRLPFTITTLSEYLGVNRSSLSREIGLMMDEGLLRMDGKTIYLIG